MGMVFDKITEQGILLFTHRRIKRNSILGGFQGHLDLFHIRSQLLGQFLGSWLPALDTLEIPGKPEHPIDGLDHVYRQTDRPSLVGDTPGNGLPDPPGRVGGKLVSPGIIIFFHRLHQADVALLDQVRQLQATVEKFFRHRNNQPQIGTDKGLPGLLGHFLPQLYFLQDIIKCFPANPHGFCKFHGNPFLDLGRSDRPPPSG